MPFTWTPELREKALMLSKEMPITDIANTIGAAHETVRYFFIAHGIEPVRARAKTDYKTLQSARLQRMLELAAQQKPLMNVWFEDVTKDEARTISANCPPSGKYRKAIQRSIYGSAAAMCVQP